VLLVRYAGEADLLAGLASFDGQLAGSVFAQPDSDEALIGVLTRLLTSRVGRLCFDAFPTGVAVALGHAARRALPGHDHPGSHVGRHDLHSAFMRPVCWQGAPAQALPAPLRDENPAGTWRRVNGQMTTEALA
jgi:NADP-dependent aldehyde dehydrogenase